ncbi:ABC transporter ATP-binding protein [Erwinia endophytica]|uniref:ABC transporter ATP-binding protein n=1 Tax=Erwinia endophytica TaxID=1563158 RepID=UPI001265DA5E|nr:ABC transporter ATP-binding protein [Erwinia endophytica]KAB8312486.1 ABC transporter ATP-binding protein [Erwinia endophytica]
MSSVKLKVEQIAKYYGPTKVLQDLDLTVRKGELLTLLGSSGSGKTTLLQIISGLTEPTSGRLLIDGRDETWTPVHQRDIGVVFQNYALFPHLTIAENVAFPLRMRRLPAAEVARKVRDALEMVELGHAAQRFPRALSGGQQQRVALARCLVYQPGIILMDEPLGALDRQLRETMQMEIRRIHRESGATIIFVTHDQEEALALSDRICLMNEGRIVQIDTPQAIYQQPNSTFVAGFIGLSNILSGEVRAGRLVTRQGDFALPDSATVQGQASLVIRPEHIHIQPSGAAALDGEICERIYAGSETRLVVALAGGERFIVRSNGMSGEKIGDRVSLGWDAQQSLLLST